MQERFGIEALDANRQSLEKESGPWIAVEMILYWEGLYSMRYRTGIQCRPSH